MPFSETFDFATKGLDCESKAKILWGPEACLSEQRVWYRGKIAGMSVFQIRASNIPPLIRQC